MHRDCRHEVLAGSGHGDDVQCELIKGRAVMSRARIHTLAL
jgi:hypothetical protein